MRDGDEGLRPVAGSATDLWRDHFLTYLSFSYYQLLLIVFRGRNWMGWAVLAQVRAGNSGNAH